MNSLFLYILKVLICSGILFLYYWLALRNKKFHQYNRFYILFSVVCSLLIPLMHLSWFSVKENVAKNYKIVRVLYEGDLDPIVVTTQKVNWNAIGLYSIIGMSAILLLLLSIRIVHVVRLTKKYSIVKWNGVDFLDTDIASAPFSFLNYLFWKHNIDLQSDVGQQILEHELTHIRQKHTWDKLFMQIVSALMWFNPFYWLMQRELSMIHEFLADEKAIGDQDVQSFATMLLEAHFGKKILSPVLPFAYRPIRRRLKMLTSSSNPKYSYMRRLFFLPLLIVVTGLFAFTVKKQDWKMPQTTIHNWAKAVGMDLKTYDTTTTVTQTKTLPDSLIIIRDNKRRDTIPNISSEKLVSIEAKVDAVYAKESSTSVTGAGNVATNSVTGLSGKVSGIRITDNKLNAANKPLYVLDGVPIDDISTINPDNIESISVLKDNSATAIYGPKGENGVLLITTKSGHKGASNTNSDSTSKIVIVRGYKGAQEQNVTPDDMNEVTVVGFGKQQKLKKQKVDKEPMFVGGKEAWKTFLMRNLRADIPTENGAPANRTYTVIVSFLVGKDGSVSDIHAENNPGYGTAEEVERLIKRSGKWAPAIKDGKPVIYRQKQQVSFQVTEESPKKKTK